MNSLNDIIFDISISPSEISSINLKKYLLNKYNGNIHNGIYISHISKVNTVECGKITADGYINIKINTLCEIVNPVIESIYNNVIITNYNKLGSFINLGKISIFIPKEYSINEEIPTIGMSINVKVIGKRIDDKITCIGKQV